MAALAMARMANTFTFKNGSVVLAASTKVFKGSIACIDTSAHVFKPAAVGNANLVRLGLFTEDCDNSASTATTRVMVSLDRELTGQWLDNAPGGSAVTAAANLYSPVYAYDDHTVQQTSAQSAVTVGYCWDINTLDGVAVVNLP